MSNASIPYFHGKNTRQSGDTARAGARGCVSFTAPITTYDTPRYGYAPRGPRATVPEAPFIGAREAFTDRADWQVRWRGVVGGCTAPIFLTDPDDSIGRGVTDEIALARRRRQPVHLPAGDGGRGSRGLPLVPYERLSLSTPNPRDRLRWRRMTLAEDGG